MTTSSILIQAFTEAGAAGLVTVALFGGVHLIPRQAKRAVRRAFTRAGL